MTVSTQPVKVKTITKRLPCQLTDEERLEFADQLADAQDRVTEATLNKKSMMKQMQSEIDAAVAHRDKINNIVASKNEYRDTDIEVKFDYEKGRVIQVRKDTGEEIINRPMTQKEKQANIFDEPELEDDK